MDQPLEEIMKLASQCSNALRETARQYHDGTTPIDLQEGFVQRAISQVAAWREGYPQFDAYPRNQEARPLTEALQTLQQPLPLTWSQVQRVHDILVMVALEWSQNPQG